MKIYYCEQRSDEWFAARVGRLTGSNAQTIAANGKGLETYVYQILAEKYSNNRDSYTNGDIERGVLLEDAARETYEIEKEFVEQVGYVEMDEYTLVSPDGLVGDRGGIEIKCHSDINHFKFLLNRKIDPKYLYQMQMFMLVSQRDWCDYVAYNPNFDQSLVVVRVFPDIVMQEKLIVGIEKGKKLVQELEEKFNKLK